MRDRGRKTKRNRYISVIRLPHREERVKIGTISGTIRFYNPDRKGYGEFYEAKDSPLVKFDSHGNPFLMVESCCRNPECDCNEVALEFIETDESVSPLADPMRFCIYLNIRTWQENRRQERQESTQRLVDEFISGLTDEMKKRFKGNYERVKEKARNGARFEMPVEDICRGRMVRYSDVFGEVLESGFEFEFEGKTYIVDDQYCTNPGCKCEQVVLVFLDVCRETETASEVFGGRLYFRKGLTIEDNPGCTKEEAGRTFDAWQKSNPDAIHILKDRCVEMKEVGQRLIAEDEARETTRSPRREKIGRNDPCPCGSGKKYKKCCGKP